MTSVEIVLQKLLQIARSEELRYPFRDGTPRVAPVEFVMACAYISRTLRNGNHAHLRTA
jgi:hypothetical protein